MIFTRVLEITVINPQFSQIATGTLSYIESSSFYMKRAFDFYIEETEHAEASQELCNLIFGEFDFKLFQSNFPESVEALFEFHKDKVERDFFDFTCFVSSECLISQSLSQISEKKYDFLIQSYLKNHARDEAEHRAYCLKLIAHNKYKWSGTQIGNFMSVALDFARLFLTYDYQLLESMEYGISRNITKDEVLELERTINKLKVTLEKAFVF